jgi:hypothetical protein
VVVCEAKRHGLKPPESPVFCGSKKCAQILHTQKDTRPLIARSPGIQSFNNFGMNF